jgi:predicted nucleotidyltransferase
LQAEYRKLAEEYLRLVKEFFGERLVSVCFFGSVVRGEATPESDLDVLIVAEELTKDIGLRVRETLPIDEELRHSEAYRRLRSLRRSAFVSDIMLTPDEVRTHPPIMLDMTQDAFVVYDKDGFLKSVLDDMRRRLSELGARRVQAKKGYYWVLKPDARLDEVVEV